jgi:hypothetical protein
MVCETLTDLQQHVAELLEIDSVTHVNLFINELKSYGIDDVEKLEDAYFGCYPTVEKFAEDFCVDVYHDEMEKLPAWAQAPERDAPDPREFDPGATTTISIVTRASKQP